MAGAALCPKFHKAIELVGSRWTGAILQVLMAGPARFSVIRDTIGEISDRMLSERLRALELEAIVMRTVLPEPPIRVEYALTPKGKELHTTLGAVARWADRWIDASAVAHSPARPRRGSAKQPSSKRAKDRSQATA